MNWQKIIWLAALLGLLAWFGPLYYRKVSELNQLRRLQERQQAQLAALEAETAALALLVERLKSDPAEMERLAREKLGLVGKDEILYKVEPEPAPPAPTPAGSP